MTHTAANTEKLNEALAHLNEAAKESREELQALLAGKYGDLKAALSSATHTSADWVKEKGKEAGATAKQAASTVDDSVHEHPWYYIGGAALAGLVIGLLISGRRG
jgi:ElaB protein